jgi:MtrB/PioB family decaheme-associated outer membrane protein
MLRYSGSFYDNSLKSIDLENPFCITCLSGAGPGDRGPNLLRLALAPSNMANAITFNSVVNLPWKSRWASTVQYNMMRQNDPFVSTQTNGLVLPDALPVMSANAKVNTFLANNVLTTQLTDNLKSTLRHRYYDVDNNTPELLWGSYVRADSSVVTTDRRNLALAYTKQNASAELNWRPERWVTLGAIYAWEQYDRTRRDVNVTNEHSGKLYLDADVWEHGKLRSSVMYAVRRYRNYDAVAFVEDHGLGYSEVPVQTRKFDIANRNRIKAEAFMDFPVNKMLTVTPNFGLRFDDFPSDVLNQLGVKRDNAWNAGIELSAKLNATALLRFSYNYERHNLLIDGTAVTPIIPANIWSSDITQHYHTFIIGADWKAIPGKLDFKFEYLLALGSEANNTIPCSSGNAGCTGSGTGVTTTQFPTERNNFQRLSVLARYFVDPDVVQRMGWKGEVVVKARYLFLRNRNTNWATDTMTPFIPTADQTTDLTGGGRSIFLAGINPNYTAHVLAMGVGVKW